MPWALWLKRLLVTLSQQVTLSLTLHPLASQPTLHRMAKLGEEGVLCLLSDSTNAEIPTFTKSEKQLGPLF